MKLFTRLFGATVAHALSDKTAAYLSRKRTPRHVSVDSSNVSSMGHTVAAVGE